MFSNTHLHAQLDDYSPQDLDALNFGVVRIDESGKVVYMNEYEAQLANLNQSDVPGKHFFSQIAPCTNNFMVAEKYHSPQEARDELLDYVFTYRVKPTPVTLRLLIDPNRPYHYLLVNRK